MSTPEPRFQKVSAEGLLLPRDATEWVAVYDAAAQLTWTRDALPCGAVTFKKAIAAAAKLDLCGFTDWRLGSRLEWAHLIEDARYAPAIDTEFFTVEDRYQWVWTGTECAPAGDAWFVYLDDGDSDRIDVGNQLHVRAVRSGQVVSAFGKAA